MKLQKKKLLEEVDESKKLIDYFYNPFVIESSLIYAFDNHQYESDIARINGNSQPFCQTIQQGISPFKTQQLNRQMK